MPWGSLMTSLTLQHRYACSEFEGTPPSSMRQTRTQKALSSARPRASSRAAARKFMLWQ